MHIHVLEGDMDSVVCANSMSWLLGIRRHIIINFINNNCKNNSQGFQGFQDEDQIPNVLKVLSICHQSQFTFFNI